MTVGAHVVFCGAHIGAGELQPRRVGIGLRDGLALASANHLDGRDHDDDRHQSHDNGVQLRPCAVGFASAKRSAIHEFYSGKAIDIWKWPDSCYSFALHHKEETVKKSYRRAILCAALLCGGVAVAQKTQPVENINPQRHGNLAAAQRLSEKAYEKVMAAQQANEFDLGGHAKKAKELLEEVNQELKMAAETSNQNHK